MISGFNPFAAQMTWFQALNLLLAAGTSVVLLVVFFKDRFLIIKPSIWLLAGCHVLMQWPMAAFSVYYETWLPRPYEFAALVHGTVIVGLLISLIVFRQTAQQAWAQLGFQGAHEIRGSSSGRSQASSYVLAVAMLGVLFVLAIALYLAEVPLRCTGLFALITSPEDFPLAREISLKLVRPPGPRYALTLVSSAIAPLLTGLLTVFVMNSKGPLQRAIAVLISVAVLVPVWMLADLTGAKGVLVALSLVVAATFLWWRRLSVNPLVAGLVVAGSLLPAVVMMTVIGAAPFRAPGSYDVVGCLAHVGIEMEGHDPVGKNQSANAILEEAAKDRGAIDPVEGSINRSQSTMTEAEDAPKGGRVESLGKESTRSNESSNTIAEDPRTTTKEQLAAMIDTLIIKQKEEIAPIVGPQPPQGEDQSFRYLNALRDNLLPIVYRAAVVPLQTGGWFVHYEQTTGPIGLAGIAKLARVLGIPVIDAPNLIGRTYGPIYYGHSVSPTISASASFVFANYLLFGMPAIAINIALILLVDAALLVFVRIDPVLLIPLLGALMPVSFKFLESEYPAVWLTHGYGVMLLLALGITSIVSLGSRAKMGAKNA